jgi:uncharacterized membrane protein
VIDKGSSVAQRKESTEIRHRFLLFWFGVVLLLNGFEIYVTSSSPSSKIFIVCVCYVFLK